MRTSHLGDSGMKKRRGRIIREGIEPVQSQNTNPSVQLLCFGPLRKRRSTIAFTFDEKLSHFHTQNG